MAYERIIVHIDYDCFYASVVENEFPDLRSLPLGIQQKSILATCNYVARAQGVKKLQLVSEAKKTCPNLVIVNGEDLSRFRDASKKLWLYVREFIWSYKVERLGFDEVFLDVTEMVDFNIANYNLADLPASVTPTSLVPHTIADDDKSAPEEVNRGIGFFRLSPTDPKQGFNFSWRDLPGHTYPPNHRLNLCASSHQSDDEWGDGETDNRHAYSKPVRHQLHRRLFLAAHLADFLRKKVHETYNYTSSAGISTTKLTAKLVGSVNKPNTQTLLLPIATQKFLDGHEIGKIPGIGYKTAHVLRQELFGAEQGYASEDNNNPVEVTFSDKPNHPVTVYDARSKLRVDKLSELLNSKDQALKVYGWLHGVDNAAVAEASLVPTQISIEDTFRSLKGSKQIEHVLLQLVAKLITRMRVDLLSPLPSPATTTPTPIAFQQKWLAYPRTFRLSVRSKDMPGPFFARISKSVPLPRYVFARDTCVEELAGKLVREVGMPLLRRIGKLGETELQLLNVAVVNMEDSKGGEALMAGVDIEQMFTGNKKKKGVFGDGIVKSEPEPEDVDWEKEVWEIEKVYKMLEDEKSIGEGGIGGTGKTTSSGAVERNVAIDFQSHREPRINIWTKADDDNEIWDMDVAGEDEIQTDLETGTPPTASQSSIRREYNSEEVEFSHSSDYEMEEEENEGGDVYICPKCDMGVLLFALEAHERFHEMEVRDV